MPNHITNCIVIRGEGKNLDDLRLKVIKFNPKSQSLYFDFNELIPQPANMFNGDLGEAERKQCKQEGRPNWYDWNVANWGTKWNAYDYKEHHFKWSETGGVWAFEFLTAWCPPEPIFQAIEKLGFKVGGLWKDEGDDMIHTINRNKDFWCWQTVFSFYK